MLFVHIKVMTSRKLPNISYALFEHTGYTKLHSGKVIIHKDKRKSGKIYTKKIHFVQKEMYNNMFRR